MGSEEAGLKSERSTATATPPRARPSWRSVAVPTEHGGWNLLLEPAVLGLIAAPSLAGAALAVAALVAFLARTPLKLVLVDRYRDRNLPRTRLAARIGAGELLVAAALLAVAAATGERTFWVPLAAAAPLVAVQLWFDRRSRSRRLAPELAGGLAMGALAAAIILAAGGPGAVAATAWLVVAGRNLASIPFVRYQVARIGRRSGTSRRASDAAQGVTLAVALGAALAGWLPPAATGTLAALAGLQLGAARRPPPSRATVAGIQQAVLGVAVAFVTALALRAELP